MIRRRDSFRVGVALGMSVALCIDAARADVVATPPQSSAPPPAPWTQSASPSPVPAPVALQPVAVGAGAMAPPPAYRLVEYRHSRRGIQIPGAIVLGVFYALALIPAVGAFSGGGLPSDRYLVLPVAGPFIVSADTNVSDGDRGWLLADGILQLAGAAGVLLGSIFRSSTFISEPVATRRDRVRWTISPLVGSGVLGAQLHVVTF